ncbi:MAG: carboxypeptidase regulatory-like domain-containing protein [Polyangiaceae bacterium]|nr:carboxypeptidase regulatory-like domain-containing protein [Polyangiaceae bacterium]
MKAWKLVHGRDEIWLLPAHDRAAPPADARAVPAAIAARQLHAWTLAGPPNWVADALRHVDGARRSSAPAARRDQVARLRAAIENGRLVAYRLPVAHPVFAPEAEPAPETPFEPKKRRSWIEIVLIDENDAPVPNAACEVTPPNGSPDLYTTDANGRIRLEDIDPGVCNISFVELDKEAWSPK